MVSGIFASGPIQFLGRTSYSIYMLHLPAFEVLTVFLRRTLHVPSHFDGAQQTLLISSPWVGPSPWS
jgi:peptidoglycan/LPS O-acetylase OafA/YrhL